MLKICGEKDEDIWAKFDFDGEHFLNKRMLLETNRRRKFTESRIKNLSHMDSHMEIRNKKYEIRNKEEEKEIVFKSEVFEFLEKYNEKMLNNFISYWTEKNKSKTKMRFELEKTFEVSRRLVTWANRDNEFNKSDVKTTLTYDEIIKLAEKDPGIMKKYKSILRPGEHKAVFELIKT
jgi:hypothetical protein